MRVRSTLVAALAIAATLAGAAKSANLPRKAPEFSISVPGGKPVSLSQYRGKTVALVFILTTCPHCQAAVRALSKEQSALGAKGLQVIASAIEESAAANVPGFIKEFQPPFPVGSCDVYAALDFMQHPRMVGPRMPMIAFIDAQGAIRAQYEGHEPFFAEDQMARNIHAKILELLGGAAPARKATPPAPASSAKK